jgi:DNA-directed RNA polymerase subunit RPC12/RpoP
VSKENGTLELAPYIDCPDCHGRGIVKMRVDQESRVQGKDPATGLVVRPHARCDGAGILILRQGRNVQPYYGRPKLR